MPHDDKRGVRFGPPSSSRQSTISTATGIPGSVPTHRWSDLMANPGLSWVLHLPAIAEIFGVSVVLLIFYGLIEEWLRRRN
jgi:hypothetical protein